MPVDVVGLDHIYVTVSDLERSAAFYDGVMRLLGFRKGTTPVDGQPHVHYFNRVMQYTIRPAKPDAVAQDAVAQDAVAHDPYLPGLHHFCFQVADHAAVDTVAAGLHDLGIAHSQPRIYPEYGDDYYALFFYDPDGIELEVVNRRHLRRLIADNWDKLEHFEDPLSKAGLL